MRQSFIVTSYNILPYIDRCLESVAACARPGDRVIVVDDGSTDGTAERVERQLEQVGFAGGVALQPILLGANTMGGVGIAGNTGLAFALTDPETEAVFFVDGDDWLEPDAFHACRQAFEKSRADILIANYAEYSEALEQHRRPADAASWAKVPKLIANDSDAARNLALSMIAVPWRKFYRADFLREHKLKFPEGPFFFEDNPFHWAVCLKAQHIEFYDRILCQHRVNRPGQTMESTGVELVAFFDHYKTIVSLIPDEDPDLAAAALKWLLNNMAWHQSRLQPVAFWPYATRAAQLLAAVPENIWKSVQKSFSLFPIGGVSEALRKGDVAGVVSVWTANKQTLELNRLRVQIDETLINTLTAQQAPVRQIAKQISALHEIARFQALSALPNNQEEHD